MISVNDLKKPAPEVFERNINRLYRCFMALEREPAIDRRNSLLAEIARRQVAVQRLGLEPPQSLLESELPYCLMQIAVRLQELERLGDAVSYRRLELVKELDAYHAWLARMGGEPPVSASAALQELGLA